MAFLKYDYPSDFLESTTNSLLVAINVAILDVFNKCCVKNTIFIEEWMAASSFSKERNTVLWKKQFPLSKHSNLQGKKN